MKKLLCSLLFGLVWVQVYAQSVPVTGSIRSKSDKTTLPGANVVLIKAADASKTATVTDTEGNFRFERVASGQYTLEVNYIGFERFTRAVQVQGAALNLGALELSDASTAIKEVEIVGRAPLGEQKGDTTVFNAQAFKTAKDASAEELVTKMPGVVIENGKVQAQGEDVQQVMIDGKRFTGSDVSTAMRNISADMVESVEVFDAPSDKAAFSGFDDGNRLKTINFRTKKEARHGYTGKVSAGYGTDERYMVGATVNYFNNSQRITLSGVTNNINMSEFSIGETPGGGMRGRRGWGGNSSPNGIATTNNFSASYNDMWGKKMEVSGNYNFTDRETINNTYVVRDYVGTDAGLRYIENSQNEENEQQHRFNFRLQYNMNENNRFLLTPSLTYNNTNNLTNRASQTQDNSGLLSNSLNRNLSETSSLTFNNNLLYSHRFGESGRILTTNFNTSYSTSEGENFLNEATENYTEPDRSISRNQFTDTDTERLSWAGNVDYSQRLGENSRLQVEYSIDNRSNNSDRLTYDYVDDTGQYTNLNTQLSSSFVSDYITQEIGPSYQYRTDKMRLQLDMRYQHASLDSESELPESLPINRSFQNLLPGADFEYKFSRTKNLNINFRSNTEEPSVQQLQNVLNITNPLQPSIGNPALDQETRNRFSLRYRSFEPENYKVFFAGIFGTMSQNYITNSVYTNGAPEELTNGYELQPGARLTRPVNLDGYWNVRSVLSYGRPLNFISSNFNLRAFAGYTRQPGMIDEEINYSNTVNMGAGFNLSSNISENLDFNVSSNANYNIVENTLRTSQDNNYFSQNTSLRLKWTFLDGIVYRTEMSHQYNPGLSAGVDESYLLWNMSIGKTIFKDKLGEISLSVNDLLKQNVSVQRNVAADYIEDVQATVLQRYFMLTFSYNLRKFFDGGEAPAEPNNLRREWGGRGRM